MNISSSSNRVRASGESPAAVIAGFLAVFAIFVAVFGIVERPVRIEPAAAVIALIAAGMAGPRQRRLVACAIVFVGAGFFLGMVVAVLTSHALW